MLTLNYVKCVRRQNVRVIHVWLFKMTDPPTPPLLASSDLLFVYQLDIVGYL